MSAMVVVAAFPAGPTLAGEACPTAGERQAIPDHLEPLSAKAMTIEGSDGITLDVVAHPLPPY
ncbi:MAG: hypothetical protein ACR2RA_15145, partial [Geminicoccaceae bacterium]